MEESDKKETVKETVKEIVKDNSAVRKSNVEEMPKAIKKEIIRILKKSQRLINRRDSKNLKLLSEETIKSASIFQDQQIISLAVAIYAISKLLERWGFESEYAEELRNFLASAQFAIEEDNDIIAYKERFQRIFDYITTIDKSFKVYVGKILDRAEIKKGGRLYEQGLSAGRSAELMNIGQWELMSYVGKTRIPEDVRQTTDVKLRIAFTRRLFEPVKPEEIIKEALK